MKRQALKYLNDWKDSSNRKPIVIRGARQVGKSYLARLFGNSNFDNLIEVNFENDIGVHNCFKDLQPKETIDFLQTKFKQRIIPGKTLLFLDEIQALPIVLAKLRYFYEQLPELHIIAAGSLLDFVLAEHDFSMPVGRIEYLHLGPMTFEEYLLATNNEITLEHLHNFSFGNKWFEPAHQMLIEEFRKYCIIGGMPEAVANFAQTESYFEVNKILESILTNYIDDFNKYGKKIDTVLMQKVFTKIPLLVGQKIKYVNIDRDINSRILSDALNNLELAKVINRIYHTNANGIPLGAEINYKRFKTLFLDVGLLCKSCNLDITDIIDINDLSLVNSGAICEQFVGQHLLYDFPFYQRPELHCWMRQKTGTSSEIDYVIQQGSNIIPVEVKAGTTGSLKSLQVFVAQKNTKLALRLNSDLPSIVEAESNIKDQEKKKYQLVSLPFYMIGQAKRLLKEVE